MVRADLVPDKATWPDLATRFELPVENKGQYHETIAYAEMIGNTISLQSSTIKQMAICDANTIRQRQ